MKSFAEIVAITQAKQSGSSWVAKCKAHDDHSPSLSLSEGDDGRTLFTCHVGCDREAILSAFGLTWADVLPETKAKSRETSWAIRDVDGKLVAEHLRLEEPNGKKRFAWKRAGSSGLAGLPVKALPLYRSEHVKDFKQGHAIVITEGEKSADAAAKLGLQSLGTVCGASATPGREALTILRDRHVILWPDWDEPGIEHMSRIAEALDGVAKSIRWMHQPDPRDKHDAADYEGTREQLKACVSQEPPSLSGPLTMMVDAIDDAIEELDKFSAGDFSDYVSTGLTTLDRRLGGGFRRGQMYLIGAPSGAGKTTLVTQFAMSAQRDGLAVIVSPEMSTRELTTREIVRRSRRPKWQRAPWAFAQTRQEAALDHADAAVKLMTERPNVAVFDKIDVKLEDVFLAVRAEAKRQRLSYIALDYAQQLADEESKESRHILVGKVGHQAIRMAREFDCPVVVTSQVNRFKQGASYEYSFRESQILEHKAHVSLLFLVERDERGSVLSAKFQARKGRDMSLFELDVAFDPATFTLEDYERKVTELKDWTGEVK